MKRQVVSNSSNPNYPTISEVKHGAIKGIAITSLVASMSMVSGCVEPVEGGDTTYNPPETTEVMVMGDIQDTSPETTEVMVMGDIQDTFPATTDEELNNCDGSDCTEDTSCTDESCTETANEEEYWLDGDVAYAPEES